MCSHSTRSFAFNVESVKGVDPLKPDFFRNPPQLRVSPNGTHLYRTVSWVSPSPRLDLTSYGRATMIGMEGFLDHRACHGVVGMALILGEAIAAYLQALAATQHSPHTLAARGYSLHRWETYSSDPILAHAVDTINDFLSRRFITLSHNSGVQEFHRFRLFLDYCVAQHWLKENPLRRLRAPRTRDVDVNVLTDEELETLLAEAAPIARTILVILLGSGMRIGELERLRWADIHNDELVLHGKGDKDRRVAPGRMAMAAIFSLPRSQPTVLPFGRMGIDYHIRHTAKKTGIPVHAHVLRHSFSDRFIRAGGTVEDLAHILGHSRLETTMVYIRRHQQERALEAQRRLNPCDALLGDTPRPGKVLPFIRR